MASDRTERRLAAIMFTDIVGYTALMAESEEKGLRARERHRKLVRPLVEKYHHREGVVLGARRPGQGHRPGPRRGLRREKLGTWLMACGYAAAGAEGV